MIDTCLLSIDYNNVPCSGLELNILCLCTLFWNYSVHYKLHTILELPYIAVNVRERGGGGRWFS